MPRSTTTTTLSCAVALALACASSTAPMAAATTSQHDLASAPKAPPALEALRPAPTAPAPEALGLTSKALAPNKYPIPYNWSKFPAASILDTTLLFQWCRGSVEQGKVILLKLSSCVEGVRTPLGCWINRQYMPRRGLTRAGGYQTPNTFLGK